MEDFNFNKSQEKHDHDSEKIYLDDGSTTSGEILLDPFEDLDDFDDKIGDKNLNLSRSIVDIELKDKNLEQRRERHVSDEIVRDELVKFLNDKISKLESRNKETRKSLDELQKSLELKESSSFWNVLELRLDRTLILGMSLYLSYLHYNHP